MKLLFTKKIKKKINFGTRRSMHLKLRGQSQLSHVIWDGGSNILILDG